MAFKITAHPSLEHRIEHLTLTIIAQPTESGLLIQRSLLYQDKKDWLAASIDLNNAAKLDAQNPELPFYFANLAFQKHQYETAKQLLSSYLNFADTDVNLLIKAEILLGEIDIQQRHHLSAAKHFYNVIKLTKKPPAHLYLSTASAYLNAGNEHIKEAVLIIEEGLNSYTGHLPLLEFQIKAHQQSNNQASILKSLQSILNHYPEHPRWKPEMARVKTRMQ